MTRRRGRRPAPGPAGLDLAAPVLAANAAWEDLSAAEQTALKRLNRGPHPEVPETVARRLVDLGLAVSRPVGLGISRSGRELVINTLLDARDR